MKLLVVGCSGQLGSDYLKIGPALGHEVGGLDYPELDLGDPQGIHRILSGRDFDVLINTAAYHGPEAYRDPSPDLFFSINVFGPFHLSRFAMERDASFITFSTDYVFSGNADPGREGFSESDRPIPANLYAASKLAGENLTRADNPRAYVFRVASLYGPKGCKAKAGSNFVEMVITKLSSGQSLEVVDDIRMSPTSTCAVVKKSLQVVEEERSGLYHLAGSGSCTWYEFASEIAEAMGFDPALVNRATTKTVHQELRRGRNTALRNDELLAGGFGDLPHWRQHLLSYLEDRDNRRAE